MEHVTFDLRLSDNSNFLSSGNKVIIAASTANKVKKPETSIYCLPSCSNLFHISKCAKLYNSAIWFNVSGWRCTSFSRVIACPLGALRPCSQFSSVLADVCKMACKYPTRHIKFFSNIYYFIR